jgi:hypothetical protein
MPNPRKLEEPIHAVSMLLVHLSRSKRTNSTSGLTIVTPGERKEPNLPRQDRSRHPVDDTTTRARVMVAPTCVDFASRHWLAERKNLHGTNMARPFRSRAEALRVLTGGLSLIRSRLGLGRGVPRSAFRGRAQRQRTSGCRGSSWLVL